MCQYTVIPETSANKMVTRPSALVGWRSVSARARKAHLSTGLAVDLHHAHPVPASTKLCRYNRTSWASRRLWTGRVDR